MRRYADLHNHFLKCALRCQTGKQSGAKDKQDGSGHYDDRVVAAQTEGARATRQHESAQGIDHLRQRIEM